MNKINLKESSKKNSSGQEQKSACGRSFKIQKGEITRKKIKLHYCHRRCENVFLYTKEKFDDNGEMWEGVKLWK